MIPLWLKLGYTGFVLLIILIWRRHYPPSNFLWFSDVALIGLVPALWLESSLLASALAVLALVPELMWNLDLALRLLLGRRIIGITEYMFEAQRPRILRGLSLFHVPLPVLMLMAVAEYGYDPRALWPAIAGAAVLLVLSRRHGTARQNINWSHRFSEAPSRLPGWLHLAIIGGGMTLLFFLPTHWLLLRWIA